MGADERPSQGEGQEEHHEVDSEGRLRREVRVSLTPAEQQIREATDEHQEIGNRDGLQTVEVQDSEQNGHAHTASANASGSAQHYSSHEQNCACSVGPAERKKRLVHTARGLTDELSRSAVRRGFAVAGGSDQPTQHQN